MSAPSSLALGFDLSTQQLKVVAIDIQNLETFYEQSLTFDTDFPRYKTTKGVYSKEQTHEVYSPVEMWIEAVDLILGKMKDEGFPFANVVSLSGAGQQHASVFWTEQANQIQATLQSGKSLKEQLFPAAFSHPYSPNWQDHSTTSECNLIEEKVGGPVILANIAGSKAHHRFTGPQILKFRKQNPEKYKRTNHISLASSFLASLFLGRIAPMDRSDVCGMNLWDIRNEKWSRQLLEIVGGDAVELELKLGQVELDGGSQLGHISHYFVSRYRFSKNCVIIPFTGDNPATVTSLPLAPMDIIISLGTSTTLLLTTKTYIPSPSYHIFNHPTTKGLYFAMLCYKNGSLAREEIRNKVNDEDSTEWEKFNSILSKTSVLGDSKPKLGFYFPLPEIIPDAPNGTWRFILDESQEPRNANSTDSWTLEDDVRAIVESQALSMRLRAQPLTDGKPSHLYFVGGASKNTDIVRVISEVLGSHEGVFRLMEGVTAGACARGGAIKAAWGYDGRGVGFEEFVRTRWKTQGRLERIDVKSDESVWDIYGSVLDAYAKCEDIIVKAK